MDKLKFPTTLKAFREQFSEEAACLEYMGQSRWPAGFACPRCASRKYWVKARRLVYECSACGQQTAVTAGTILHRTHFSLREWFWAAYLVATHIPGMSGTQLQRQMGCSYKTAWYLRHRLRRSMVNELMSSVPCSADVWRPMKSLLAGLSAERLDVALPRIKKAHWFLGR
jgi:Zn ribbon nucleic-acid-binding protein